MRSTPNAGRSVRNWAGPVLRLIEASELLDRQVTASRGGQHKICDHLLNLGVQRQHMVSHVSPKYAMVKG